MQLQNDDSFQLDNKTIDDAESVGPYEMERGRQRERQVCLAALKI